MIKALQREIEEKAVVVTIARRQPMAVDLWEIIGDLRISNDLERIGDLAENIAIEAATLGDEFGPNAVMLQLDRMTKLVVDQLVECSTAMHGVMPQKQSPHGVGTWKSTQ